MLAEHKNRDLQLTSADFECVRKLIHDRAGISLAPHKVEMVYSRLSKRLRVLGQRRFADYLKMLQTDTAHPEWEYFTNALTTNLTAFFREAHHFPTLAEHARAHRGSFRVWSCAASTGEEVYSIAMTLAEVGATAGNVSILGTDIDTRALEVAAAGIYPMNHVNKIPPERLKRFFLKGAGARTGMVRVHPKLRAMVEFRALNLLASQWDIADRLDVIFCRNLLIYFDKQTQRRVLERFATLLKPDGLLFAGHSENLAPVAPAFRLRRQTVYELNAAGRQALERSA